MEEDKITPQPQQDGVKKKGDAVPLSVDLYFWLQACVLSLVSLILVFTFIGRLIGVDGSSMLPTLHHRDLILLQHIGYTPAQSDVVVLTKQFADVNGPIVKRVIATGGQTVDVDYASGKVFVDGEALEEPYINELMLDIPGSQNTNTHAVVPQGSIFVMGDNRNHSSDSRHPALGVVDERYVLGRAFFVLFPFQNFGTI